MAGNLPVPQVAEVKIVWSWQGNPYALNILHFEHDVGAVMTQAKANSISTLIATAVTSSGYGALIQTGVTLARTEVRHMDSNTDPWYVGTAAAVPGTSAANPLPAATAFVVTLKTGLRGRSYNGRVYLWGFTEDANDAAGGITVAAAGTAVSFVNTIMANMSSAEQMDLTIVSRWTTPPGSPPNTPPTERNPPIHSNVTSLLANDLRWDVQRRRAIPGI